MTTEELKAVGLPHYMEELVNWRNTETVRVVGHRAKSRRGVLTAVEVVNSNQSNLDSFIRNNGMGAIGPINNDGSRTITSASGNITQMYFNEDGSVNHADIVSGYLLNFFTVKFPNADPEVIKKIVTYRYEFVQKGDYLITSILPKVEYDGLRITNKTLLDGVDYQIHPAMPAAHFVKWHIGNHNNEPTSRAMTINVLVSPTGVLIIVDDTNSPSGADPQAVNLDNGLPEAEHFINIAESDLGDEPRYEALNNTLWLDFSRSEASVMILWGNDHVNKAESSLSPILHLK